MKKSISVLLALVMLFGCFAMTASAAVTGGEWVPVGYDVDGAYIYQYKLYGTCTCENADHFNGEKCHCCVFCPNLDDSYLTKCAIENNENGENNENSDDQNQNTEPSDPNKITEADWKAFLAITNYTVTQAIKGETTTYKSSGEALEIVSPEDGTTYYVIKDSKTYKVSNGIGTKVNSNLSIGDMVLKGLSDLFADMTYDGENHSYSLSVSSYDPNIKGDYSFYFENGVLLRAAKVKGVTMTSYEFSSYGTTKVEAPDFEITSW